MINKNPKTDPLAASSEKMITHLMQLRQEFQTSNLTVPYPLNQCSYQIAATILQATFAESHLQKIKAYKNTQTVLRKTEHFILHSSDTNRLLADYKSTLLQDLRTLYTHIEEIILLLSVPPK